MFMTAFITVIAAYLIGSVNFAIIFTKVFMNKDIRDVGSGNAGATNVMRTGGVLPGVLTFVCDALKGFIASGLGYLIFSYIYNSIPDGNSLYYPIYGAYICGIFCLIGHIFPLFFGFKGGKGVSVGVGIMAVCSIYSVIIGLCVFTLTVVFSKYVSLGSLVGTLVTVIFSVIFAPRGNNVLVAPQILMAVIIGLIVIVKHSSNIKRLINGEENKIGRKKA